MSSAATSKPSAAADEGAFIPRVLLAKSFIDSHDRAITTIAMALRDAAMEVVLVEYQIPDEIAAAAVQEDADIIGVSFMSGGQVDVTQRLSAALKRAGRGDLPIVIGGVIRPFDVPDLEQAGVRAIFRGGETLESVVKSFRELAAASRNQQATRK
jgi:methylmalonyl-CoA mutase C-terminal domain/subunit